MLPELGGNRSKADIPAAGPRGPICHETFMKLFGMPRGCHRLSLEFS